MLFSQPCPVLLRISTFGQFLPNYFILSTLDEAKERATSTGRHTTTKNLTIIYIASLQILFTSHKYQQPVNAKVILENHIEKAEYLKMLLVLARFS